MFSSDAEAIEKIFGITPEFRVQVHREIFQLCYNGKGGFTWYEVYNMPIWLRKFYIKEINRAIKERNEAVKKASKKGKRVIDQTDM